MLRQNPGYTAVAVISLALGIGANTAIFSAANALLIRPLPVEDIDTLASVFTSNVGGAPYGITSYPDYADLRDRNQVFTELAAQTYIPMGLKGPDRTEVVAGQLVSWNYFSVLGIQPSLGRPFLPEEDQTPGTHPVAILSDRIWKSLFGTDPEIIGRTIHINGYPFTVVGVAPEGFRGMSVALATDVWVPLHMADQATPYTPQFDGRIDPWLYLVGRLRPGKSLAEAQADMDVLASNLEDEYPDLNQGKGFPVVAAGRNRIGIGPVDEAKALIVILMGVVGVVLLIAAFNVANLHLARATARQREMVLRFSLGASVSRIVRQLLTESVLLSLLAGAAGLLVAMWAMELTMAVQPIPSIPIEIDFGFDTKVLGFILLLSLLTGVFFGLAPALQTLRPDQTHALRGQPMSHSPRKATSRLQNVLVTGQVALSLVLLICAGLLLKSLDRTSAVDPGFDLRNGLVVSVNLGFSQHDETEGRSFYRQLFDRIESLPGVESASAAAFVPFGQGHGRHDVTVDGYEPKPDEFMVPLRNMVDAHYFETMGIPIVRGRGFDEWDREDSKPVALVNETMARRFWPGRDPVGSRIWADLGVEREVIGIVKDGRYLARVEEQQPYLYIPLDQAEYLEHMHFVVRTTADPLSLFAPIQQEVQKLDANLPPPIIGTMAQYLEQSVFSAKGQAFVITVFGLLAMAVAMAGVYGVMSYIVSQRTHEYGVRLALGAKDSEIVSLVLRRGLTTALSGIALGLAGAFAATRILTGLLYNVSPIDPIVFAAVSLALAVIALVACFLPARSAAKVNPIEVLRAE
jgi:putative ABC transport system permease protein